MRCRITIALGLSLASSVSHALSLRLQGCSTPQAAFINVAAEEALLRFNLLAKDAGYDYSSAAWHDGFM
jgi:hypothetical protein